MIEWLMGGGVSVECRDYMSYMSVKVISYSSSGRSALIILISFTEYAECPNCTNVAARVGLVMALKRRIIHNTTYLVLSP